MFHALNKEKAHLNQYWYSTATVRTMVDEILSVQPSRVACLSTPSIFSALIADSMNAVLFDIDPTLAKSTDHAEEHVVLYDFHSPDIAKEHQGIYDFIVVDPPFIDVDVLKAYSQTVAQLGKSNSRILITTTAENEDAVQSLFGGSVHPVLFMPHIPNLVYQYQIYVNYPPAESSPLNSLNSELI